MFIRRFFFRRMPNTPLASEHASRGCRGPVYPPQTVLPFLISRPLAPARPRCYLSSVSKAFQYAAAPVYPQLSPSAGDISGDAGVILA